MGKTPRQYIAKPKKKKEKEIGRRRRKTHVLIDSHSLGIPTTTKAASKPLQAAGLVLFNIQQLLRAGVPQRRVAHVLCGAQNGGGRGGALGEGGAVGQGDELGEGIGALGTAQEGGMARLLVLMLVLDEALRAGCWSCCCCCAGAYSA